MAAAASPDAKNTRQPRSTPTASTTPTPISPPADTTPPAESVEASPVKEPDVAPAFSWESVNGTWCTISGDCVDVVDYGHWVGSDRFVLQMTDAVSGCLLGEEWSIEYPGSQVLYCPAYTPTPPSVFNATSVYEAVNNDDMSRERIWFFQGWGSDTYFKQ